MLGNCLIFVFALVVFTTNGILQDSSDLLSEEESLAIFGTRTLVPEYSLISPKFLRSSNKFRSKRDSKPEFAFDAFGRSYLFRLTPVDDLVSSNITVLRRSENGIQILDWSVPSCTYAGASVYDEREIALTTCGHMRGLIKGGGEELIIEPLPEGSRRQRRSLSTSSSHVVYKRRLYKGCSLKEELEESPKYEEKAYLFSRHPENFYKHQRLPGGKDELYSKTSFGQKPLDKKIKGLNSKRLYDETLYIETAVFVDKDLLHHMKTYFPSNTEEEVINVVLAMVNAVQLLYHDESLGHKIKFVLKRLDLMHEDPVGLTRPHNIDDFLTNFCSWQHLQNPTQDKNPLHWDHAVILTGLDIFTVEKDTTVNSAVVGLAPVAGMCTRTSSCTVNEGKHFESVYVVAHEIGHNLGMKHDGLIFGNNCDPSGYLMSPTLGSGKVTWSHCSKKYLEKFLRTSQSSCIRDKPNIIKERFNHEKTNLLPGQRFTADQQCMLKYGIGSHMAVEQPIEDICKDLHCSRNHFIWTSHPALEGTKCGLNKWCKRGKCTYVSDTSSRLSSSSVAEWGKWTDCDSACLYGSDGILSSGSTGLSISQQVCRSCPSQYRYQVCSSVRDCAMRPRMTIQEFADEACHMMSRDNRHLSGVSIRIPKNGLDDCLIPCLTQNEETKLTRAHFPDGTVCRSIRDNQDGTVCRSIRDNQAYCVRGTCMDFTCEGNSLYMSSPSYCGSIANSRTETPISHHPQEIPHTNLDHRPMYGKGSDFETSFGTSNSLWTFWRATSDCRYSCINPGRGIQLVSRSCRRPFCDGFDRNIKLCEAPTTRDCPVSQTPFEHANSMCQHFSSKINQLSGLGMQLSSTLDDPDRSCTVACQDASLQYRFYRVNGREGWFPFGTECINPNAKRKSYCLNGICMEFNHQGIPLNKDNTRSKGRSLEFNSNKITFSDILESRSSNDIKVTAGHKNKRDVRIVSHRIPGSIDNEFFLTLVDEFNSTEKSASSQHPLDSNIETVLDLHNPIFYQSFPIKKQNETQPLFNRESSNPNKYQWRVKYSECTTTCEKGFREARMLCSDDDGGAAPSTKHCSGKRPNFPKKVPCSGLRNCKETSVKFTALHTHFGNWLLNSINNLINNKR